MDLSNSSANGTQSPGPISSSTLSNSSLPTSTIPTSPSSISVSFFASGSNVAAPLPSNKMYSKNSNGTAILTTIPGNDAELQLYRVMQRASLLVYYDTLLEMGGDDVQQLCDAGEEEFLEIMALVGMASKPLHVRRFQKSLQEWMIDPSAFQVPLASPSSSAVECCSRRSILDTSSRPIYSPSPGRSSPAPSVSRSSGSRSASPSGVTDAVLSEAQTSILRTAAERLSSRLPSLKPRIPVKRRIGRELDAVIALPETDPKRMDGIRRYAAIYGRFDCKRRPEKPLTLHEVSVNEAAAQLCHFVPALLTRRDELFPLARQIVRDSGVSNSYVYPNSIINKPTHEKTDADSETEDEPPPKKQSVADIAT